MTLKDTLRTNYNFYGPHRKRIMLNPPHYYYLADGVELSSLRRGLSIIPQEPGANSGIQTQKHNGIQV